MQTITPHLWFDDQAEEAAEFYTSVFPNSEIVSISRYSDVGHEVHGRPAGSVMTVTFTLDGQTFIALNGGPHFKFSEAISFFITCATQEEVDYYWERLAAGGEEGPCGWLKDKYGLSWQVVPTALGTLLADKEAGNADRVMEALLQMKKIDIAALQQVYDGQQAG